MAGGLPPAPRWAWIVMALGVVAIGGMSYLALHRPPPPGFTASAASSSPTTTPTSSAGATPTSASPSATAAEAVKILVVGDDYTADAERARKTGWTQLISQELATDERGVAVDTAAADGSGYLAKGRDGETFGALAEQADKDYDLVVFFGSRNDIAAATDLEQAAVDAFTAARAGSPDAHLLVVGPMWPAGKPPGYILTNRDTAAAAAAREKATFIDPLAEGWLTDQPAAVDAANGSLTDEGQRKMAELLRPGIERALGA